MVLQHIRLELARCAQFPEGSAAHGYEFIAPLDDEGHLDAALWRDHRDACTVRRFWGDDEEEHGRLMHRGKGWRFHYPGDDVDEDDTLFKLDRHSIVEGDYLSINEEVEGLMTFKVVSVRPSPLG